MLRAVKVRVNGSIFLTYCRNDIGYPSRLRISSAIRIVIEPKGVRAPPMLPERTKPIHKPVVIPAGRDLNM